MIRIIPTTIVAGFLEAGKSSLIQHFLESDEINACEHVLLLACEEGIVEFAQERFKSRYVQICHFDSSDEFDPVSLCNIAVLYRANRVIIECNGMWSLQELMQKLPGTFNVTEIVTIIDGSSFHLYNTNLHTMLADKLRFSHTILLNRVPDHFDRDEFEKIISVLAPRSRVCRISADGKISEYVFQRKLPVPEKKGEIMISNETFPAMYREIYLHPEDYETCTVTLNGRLIKDAFGNYSIGRYTMVCCMDDLAFSGFPVDGSEETACFLDEWVSVSGTIYVAYNRAYGRRGPIIRLSAIKATAAPSEEII